MMVGLHGETTGRQVSAYPRLDDRPPPGCALLPAPDRAIFGDDGGLAAERQRTLALP